MFYIAYENNSHPVIVNVWVRGRTAMSLKQEKAWRVELRYGMLMLRSWSLKANLSYNDMRYKYDI